LFNEILPNARKVWGINNFEIFIGGRTKLPQVYEKNLSHYSEVKYLGFINDLDSTLNQFTALLIPISLPLGNRTRVLDGLSFGIPVVGHKAICGGNPFLVDGINCALAKTGSEFISKLDKICEDSNYRNNIISNGILTYDLTYNPKNDHILQLLN
jgi:glycosyltransferase involved in cell wall biosynthesis